MIAKCKHRNSGTEIQIFLSFGIIKMYAFSFFKNNRETIIGVQNHLFRSLHIFIHFHCKNVPPHPR